MKWDLAMTVIVHGLPAPQGSKRFVGLSRSGRGILVESSAKVKPWREAVKAAVVDALSKCRLRPLDEPVSARMTFTLPKPASSPKRRRTRPMRKPDLSKLIRSTEDALTDGGLLADDARIVHLEAWKVYPCEGTDALETPGAVIHIYRLMDP